MEGKTELQRNAIAEARRKELESFQRALDIQWLNSRMEDGRMGRCLALIQREAEMEKDFQEKTDHAAIVNARAEKEIALGMEVAKVQREEACKLLRRHYLWQRDPGLRELATKLQAGYVCRDLRQQILHNEYRRLQDKSEEKQANSILANALYNDQEAKDREDREKMERTTAYKRDLQSQLVNRQREKQCVYEDTLVEKKMLEDVMRTIADEDKRELEQKRMLMERTRGEMVTFQKARDAWRRKQKTMVVIEERQIEEQRRAAADRSSAIVAERERKMREKEELNQRIAAKILADEAARQERENIIKLLQEQEYLEKNCQDDLAERDKLERVKRETKQALTAQMDNRKQLAHKERVVEAEFRKIAEAKMAADEAKEREKETKKKEKARIYSEALLKQIEDNSRRRQKDHALEESRAQNIWDTEKAWNSEVSEERKKIIQEHGPPLLGYLQAGVLARADLPAVRAGADLNGELATLDIESMAGSSGPRRFSKCNDQCRVLREF